VNVVAMARWGLLRQKKNKKGKSNVGHKRHITSQFTDIPQLEF
jgi:hypothetical protein